VAPELVLNHPEAAGLIATAAKAPIIVPFNTKKQKHQNSDKIEIAN
jgi:hypothetical protein